MTTSPSSRSGTSSSMTASVGGPAWTMIMIRRGLSRAATNSSVVVVRTKSPSPPCAASSASVRAWLRLCTTTWCPCRAKLRARLAPIVANPVTPICSLMARIVPEPGLSGTGPRRGGSARWANPSAEAELAAELGHVAGRLDVVGRLLDAPLGVDDEGRPDDPDDLLAVQLLRAVRAIGGEHLLVRVGHEGDGQVLLLPEPHEL